jgi:hypothetical protein
LEKLYSPEEYAKRSNHSSQWRDEEVGLVSPSPSPSPTPPSPISVRRRVPIALEVFEEDARRQAELEVQSRARAVGEDVRMEG